MSGEFSYQSYVTDSAFLSAYNDYQARYANSIRESDKILIDIVRSLAAAIGKPPGQCVLADLGCSTGNLLLHLKRLMPDLSLIGGDLAESSLAACRANPDLAGVSFETLDVLALPHAVYDIAVVNAVLYMFDDSQYALSLASLRASLKPGGALVMFDFAQDFEQELRIVEKTRSHPDGLLINFRSFGAVARAFGAAGFAAPEFRPFELPIDLAPAEARTELRTFTYKLHDGRRLAMRGALAQPWCHIVARAP
jgi:SAM-dependent methyltransferase